LVNQSKGIKYCYVEKNRMSLLSVIIINYNTFKYTCSCITSIYKHTKIVPFEVILVDNASTECDPDCFKKEFPQVKLVRSDTNLGFASGNNLGIEHSSGDMILLLNSDTELIEDSLSYCYKYAKSLSYNAALTCKLIYPNNIIQRQCSRFPSIFLNFIELFRIHKLLSKDKRGKLLLSDYFDHEEKVEPEWIWGTFFMFNKSILLKMSGQKLDDSFFMYCEDMKWCFDFKKLNVKILYLPYTKVIHHLGSSSGSEYRLNTISKNELLFVKQTRGQFYKWVYILVRVANLLSSFSTNGKLMAVSLIKNG
jgi:GT2 family glycosyltransferase